MQDGFAGPARQSFLRFVFDSCGWQYAVGIPFVAFMAFLVALILVWRGKDSLVGPALLFVVPLPLLVGLWGTMEGLLQTMMVIASSPMAPKPSEFCAGFTASIVTSLMGMFFMGPALLTAVIGLFVRAMVSEPKHAAS